MSFTHEIIRPSKDLVGIDPVTARTRPPCRRPAGGRRPQPLLNSPAGAPWLCRSTAHKWRSRGVRPISGLPTALVQSNRVALRRPTRHPQYGAYLTKCATGHCSNDVRSVRIPACNPGWPGAGPEIVHGVSTGTPPKARCHLVLQPIGHGPAQTGTCSSSGRGRRANRPGGAGASY
jgi:hypothetical protein